MRGAGAPRPVSGSPSNQSQLTQGGCSDVRGWVVVLARMAGWRPSKRQPLPGNEVLWRACVQLQMMVRVLQAARAP